LFFVLGLIFSNVQVYGLRWCPEFVVGRGGLVHCLRYCCSSRFLSSRLHFLKPCNFIDNMGYAQLVIGPAGSGKVILLFLPCQGFKFWLHHNQGLKYRSRSCLLISWEIADKCGPCGLNCGPNCGRGQLKNNLDIAAQITVTDCFLKPWSKCKFAISVENC